MVTQPKQPTKQPFTKVGDLEEFMEKANSRAKAMLRKECTLMLQCRCCANIFRRLPNFILHKQKYCRNEYAAVGAASVRTVGSEGVPPRHHPVKTSVPIRRTNIVRYVLNKAQLKETSFAGALGTAELTALPKFRRQAVIVPSDDGHSKCYVEAPHVLSKDSSANEVLMVVPQDLSVQYCDMSLRRRSALPVARKVSIDEAECLNKIVAFVDVDPVECRCLAPTCCEIRPFKNIYTLAYHVSMKHCRKTPPVDVLPCMMCTKSFITWETYYNHISSKHDRIRHDHRMYRENESRKRGRKPKEERVDRSMSPDVSGKKLDEQEAEAKEWMKNVNKVISNLASEPPSGVRRSEAQLNPSRKLDSIINKILRWHLRTIAENLTKSQPGVEYGKRSDHSSNTQKTINSADNCVTDLACVRDKIISNMSPIASPVGKINENSCTTVKSEERRCFGETGVLEPQHASNEALESNIPKSEGASSNPHSPDCGSKDLESHEDEATGDDQKAVDVDDCDTDASDIIDVVGDDSSTVKTERTQMETDEKYIFEEWDGDSTKACKSDVDDEDSLDKCSTTSTLASLTQLTELCLHDDSPQLSPGYCDSPQLSRLGGDDDLEDIEDDNDSVGNVSTTVVPKTSNSPESGSDRVSTACSLQPNLQIENDLKEPCYDADSPDAASEYSSDVIPTPLSNFAPLSYFNYGYVDRQNNDSLTNVELTAAHRVSVQNTSTPSTISISSNTHFLKSQEEHRTYRSHVLPVREQRHSVVATLKRPRSLDGDQDDHDLTIKRAMEEDVPLSCSASLQRTNAAMDTDSLRGNLTSQCRSDMVAVLSCCKEELDEGPDPERSELAVEWTGPSSADSDSSRTQRCQRVRRMPARYRDDYVCALNDADSGDESVKRGSSVCSSVSVSPSSVSRTASSNQVPGQQDLSSSQYSLAGTRWNAVFSSLLPADPSQPKGAQYCGDCGDVCPSLEIARRHVLSHIRLVRFVCKLCGVGGFFATDLRLHLMKGLCTGLQRSSQGFAPTINSAVQADSLCKAADDSNPGAIVYFDGEHYIVSSENINAHKPCVEIERRILERCV